MYQNIYRPVQSLQKSPITVGGMCSLTFFKIEDVLVWPAINPATGIIDTSVQMKPGKTMFICQSTDKGRIYDEELKYEDAGPYVDMAVQGILGGHNSSNALTLQAAAYHRWGLIVADRNGDYRLLGNKDSGAKLVYKYTTGDASSSRKVALTFSWAPSMPARLYNALLFNITIGGIIISAGTLKFLTHFQVDAAGAPMADAQTTLTNAAFAGKKLLVLVDGLALPCDDATGSIDFTNSIIRHYAKTAASSTITFVGGVVHDEIIEIYEIS